MPKATTTTTTATAATTMTTRLSTCGGFVTRRISQMQARNEHRSSIATASPMSFGNCLRHEPVSVAATIEAPTTAATTTATVACQRLCGLQPCSLMCKFVARHVLPVATIAALHPNTAPVTVIHPPSTELFPNQIYSPAMYVYLCVCACACVWGCVCLWYDSLFIGLRRKKVTAAFVAIGFA